jgi:hypothetical protein
MTPEADAASRSPMQSRQSVLIASALLAVAVAAVYAAARLAGWCRLDDFDYVTLNPLVRDGLTLEGLHHAFFESQAALWMPLSFTSHMLDVTLFGLDPTGPHVENVVLHAVNAVLLLVLLVRATGALWPSAVAAALFALHPLRVESVVWIAERKDVLSVFFGLVTLHAWVTYAHRPSLRHYAAVVACTILALLSKPMLVTLPILLLLVDWWPLRRLERPRPDGGRDTLGRLVVEKIPLLLLAAATAAITLATTHASHSLDPLSANPIGKRIVHALVASVWYVGKTVWPTELSVYYRMPVWAGWQIAGAAGVLALEAALVVAAWRRAPWVAVGFLWFGVALFPVSGLFQAGNQGMADRFTYLPSIGLAMALVWSLDAAVHSTRGRAALGVASACAIVALAIASQRQVAVWHDDRTLIAHGLAIDPDNWFLHANMGDSLLEADRPAEAYAHFVEANRLQADFPMTAFGLAASLDGIGRTDEAVAQYRETLRIDPTYWRAHNNLGIIMMKQGKIETAVHHFAESLRLRPYADEVKSNLRIALAQMGLGDDAANGYLEGIGAWFTAVSADGARPGGADYGSALRRELLGAHADAVRNCLTGESAPAPFSLYVSIDGDGALAEITPVPPTRVARCLGDELRATRTAAPPFAPFHGQVTLVFHG